MYQETYDFVLPVGIKHNDSLIKNGVMRLATAGDEMEAAASPKVKENPEYISILLLAAVIVRLGDLEREQINPELIMKLKTADFTYLQNMYTTINEPEEMRMKVACPQCAHAFYEPVNFTFPGLSFTQ